MGALATSDMSTWEKEEEERGRGGGEEEEEERRRRRGRGGEEEVEEEVGRKRQEQGVPVARPKRIGVRIAGHKNRRKKKLLGPRYNPYISILERLRMRTHALPV